jgi:DNA polymerase-3 subunit alpha (Gram-positive type)
MITALIAFDTETTGFNPREDSLIEIGAVRFGLDGEPRDQWQCFADPDAPLSARIRQLTGIDDDMLRGAPSPLDAVRGFVSWAGEGAVFLAHNADFDMRFLNASFLRAGEFAPRIPVIDTLPWARAQGWPVIDHKLGTLLRHLGHNTEGLHRALADADGVRALAATLLRQEPDPATAILQRLGARNLPTAKTSFDSPSL